MYRYRASFIFVLSLCVLTLMKINIASANDHFDMTKLDDQTQKQIKAACYFQKMDSSKVYADCLAKETRKAFSTNMQGLKTDALIFWLLEIDKSMLCHDCHCVQNGMLNFQQQY